MEAETKKRCDEMVRQAKEESQRYWDQMSARMTEFYETHPGLREVVMDSENPFGVE